mgnify:CR=1 FL=1
MAKLTILQQNLHKSLLPTQELLAYAGFSLNQNPTLEDCKILCVQEPNIRRNKVCGFPSLSIYSQHIDSPIRSAIISRNSTNILKLTQYCTSDLVVVRTKFGDKNLCLCRAYIMNA